MVEHVNAGGLKQKTCNDTREGSNKPLQTGVSCLQTEQNQLSLKPGELFLPEIYKKVLGDPKCLDSQQLKCVEVKDSDLCISQ